MPTDESTPTDNATPDDAPPELSRREAADVARASVISTADIDAAGRMWREYAGAGLAGLWDAGDGRED